MSQSKAKDPQLLFLAEIPEHFYAQLAAVGDELRSLELRFRTRKTKFSSAAKVALTKGVTDQADAMNAVERVVVNGWDLFDDKDERLELKLIAYDDNDRSLWEDVWSMAKKEPSADKATTDLRMSMDLMKVTRSLTHELRQAYTLMGTLSQATIGSVREMVKAKGEADSKRWEMELEIAQINADTQRFNSAMERLPLLIRLLNLGGGKKGERPAWIDELLAELDDLSDEEVIAKYGEHFGENPLVHLQHLNEEEAKRVFSRLG